MKNLILTTLLLCTMLLSVLPCLATDVEVKRKTLSETSLRNAILFDGVSNITAQNSIASATKIKRKNPWLAFGLSFVAPGAGQFYNGQPYKGALQIVMYIGGYTAFLLATDDDIVYSDGTVLDVNDDDAIGGFGILIAAGTWLWSVIDAPISANNINTQNQLQAHSLNQKGYAVSPFVKRNQLGAKLAFRF